MSAESETEGNIVTGQQPERTDGQAGNFPVIDGEVAALLDSRPEPQPTSRQIAASIDCMRRWGIIFPR